MPSARGQETKSLQSHFYLFIGGSHAGNEQFVLRNHRSEYGKWSGWYGLESFPRISWVYQIYQTRYTRYSYTRYTYFCLLEKKGSLYLQHGGMCMPPWES